MLTDDKVTSVRFLKDKVLATRISQEKKFEPYFRVPIKYPINLQDYIILFLLLLLLLFFMNKHRTRKHAILSSEMMMRCYVLIS